MKMKNQYIGLNFEEFLDEEGIKEEVEANAIKKVIAYQIKKEMERKHLTKTTLAKRMHTSRSAVDRLFKPDNDSLTLVTLSKAATALGKKLKIELV
jgi:predicted XRE-type DNA-binding protein